MLSKYDPSAIGSDIPRSRKQYMIRKLSELFVKFFGLNKPGAFSTEIAQAINPIATINTQYGPLFCKSGHGRLLWRARTFYDEEPQTIEWLDTLQESDVFWDIGANVGLYSTYAGKFKHCKVIAFEPESQNYALLIENIFLNNIQDNCIPACIPISNQSELGYLHTNDLTKGGAYNTFIGTNEDSRNIPESIKAVGGFSSKTISQLMFTTSLNELLHYDLIPSPTYLKIDVDGLEPTIIEGASELLAKNSLKTILIEINKKSPRDMKIPEILKTYGFKFLSERSNWCSRKDKTKEEEMPATNMIFSKNNQ